MSRLVLKGHSTRSVELIQLLVMLSAKSQYTGTFKGFYYWIEDGQITSSDVLPKNSIVFSLEEFEEKYPYKVGDKVILDEIPCTITWMCWECNNIYYQVQGVNDIFTKKVTAEKLKPYKGETMEDKDIIEHTTEINLNHPCFDGHDKIKLIIPENWKFEQRGNKMFGIRKYPQYPKTYKECCDVVNASPYVALVYDLFNGQTYSHDIDNLQIYENLRKLKICRDAYWRVIGEQMGLDKPWKYDMSKNEFSCAISYEYGSIQKCEVRYRNHFLVFPTKEMRDEFYKNFKELIEQCKELL